MISFDPEYDQPLREFMERDSSNRELELEADLNETISDSKCDKEIKERSEMGLKKCPFCGDIPDIICPVCRGEIEPGRISRVRLKPTSSGYLD